MEAGCGGGDRAGGGGIDSLVAGGICGVVASRAADIRGQWSFTDGAEMLGKIFGAVELKQGVAFLVFLEDLGGERGRAALWGMQIALRSRGQTAPGSDQGPPVPILGFFQKQEFHRGTAVAFAPVKACGEDAGIIHDQDISGPQECGEIPEFPVTEGTCTAVEDQEAGTVAAMGGLLGDACCWKVIIEIGAFQAIRHRAIQAFMA